MTILVTGSAGFIGYHVAERLLADGHQVVGLDCLNDYYDVNLKRARLARLEQHAGYHHSYADLANRSAVEQVFSGHRIRRVVHLAAQAGVRYAATNPHAYIASNITGFLHVLEGCRHHGIEHLVYASTSSVYGANRTMPFSEHHPTAHPLTLYAATKKSNEMMAHSYAHLFGLPCTGLRFFTVYGPWGRPDMALFLFTKAILAGEPLKVFNHGRHKRSFTYVDDIVEGIVRVLDKPPAANSAWDSLIPDPATSAVPYRIFNIGSPSTVELLRYIELIEDSTGRKAALEMLPLQPGDVPDSEADCGALATAIDYVPCVQVEEGVPSFVRWYRKHYDV
ncbi:MAG: NAD-dependent epimerase [Xanthomonadales bacterium PRO6]|nr:UDP-N-acetylglucosamine 4-epimerase [Xanthomonadales bacterium]MCE7930715.1 NAD-dependent epimerase [Xanthomonadales bacterium PRO6]